MHDQEMSLVKHFEELRSRLCKSAVLVIVCSLVLYKYSDLALYLLARPIGTLVFTAPHEAFITNLKIAFLGGILISSPFIIYEIWQFIAVGLTAKERKYIGVFTPLSFMLFTIGIVFGFFIIVPISIHFLLGFGGEFIKPMIMISHYLSFVGTLTFAFGVVFQLPLVMLFLTKMALVTPLLLARKRKIVIVVIFVVAAMLTPPDIISQVLMAVPLIVLYEIGIIASRVVYKPQYKSID